VAANIDPIYSRTGAIANGTGASSFPAVLTAANVATDGTGTVTTVFTADATNGSYLKSIKVKVSWVTGGAGTTTATVMRFYINNGSANSTAQNNALFAELQIPAITIGNATAGPDYEIPCNFALPAGFKINATIGTASTPGFIVFGIGGNY